MDSAAGGRDFSVCHSFHNFPKVQVKLKGEEVKAVAESWAIGKGAQTDMPSGQCGVWGGSMYPFPFL